MIRRLKVFLSYAAEQLDVAERLYLTLANVGHEVFFDRTSLPPGKDYNPAILAALRSCDLFVFLVSPAAIEQGAYSLAELRLAREVWSSPDGHILPIMAVSTPMSAVPSYLRAVSILVPQGDLVAEACAAVDKIASGWSPVQTAIGQAEVLERSTVEISTLRLEKQILDLDRRWEAEKAGFMIEVNNMTVIPTIESAVSVLVVLLAFGGLAFFFFYRTDPGFFGILPVLIPVAIGVLGFGFIYFKANRYDEAEAEYQRERQSLYDQVRSLKRRS